MKVEMRNKTFPTEAGWYWVDYVGRWDQKEDGKLGLSYHLLAQVEKSTESGWLRIAKVVDIWATQPSVAAGDAIRFGVHQDTLLWGPRLDIPKFDPNIFTLTAV